MKAIVHLGEKALGSGGKSEDQPFSAACQPTLDVRAWGQHFFRTYTETTLHNKSLSLCVGAQSCAYVYYYIRSGMVCREIGHPLLSHMYTGPWPMQLVVVRVVSTALSTLTMTWITVFQPSFFIVFFCFRFQIQVSEVTFHHRFHRLHRFWLRVVDAISQIYWDYSG